MKKRLIKAIAISFLATTVFTTSIVNAKTINNVNTTSNQEENVLKVDCDSEGNVSYQLPVSATEKYTETPFSWDNATVYFVMTDRFNNGNTENDHAYGRSLDANGNVQNGYKDYPGTYHGGDLQGLTKKVEEGYFNDLGVNAIWITCPVEQIHGYTSGNLSANDNNLAGNDGDGFAYYGYTGYWALDFSALDANLGSRDEAAEVSEGKPDDMRDFVDSAHDKGIRVILDVVMNHVGYFTLKDVDEFGFGEVANGFDWKSYYYGEEKNRKGGAWEATTCYNTNSSKWSDWWGGNWIRTERSMNGYTQGATDWTDPEYDHKVCSGGLPDIISEDTGVTVDVPTFLKNKWKKEGRLDSEMKSLDNFFDESGLPKRPINYIIKWLCDWVKDYGIDGFRCDTAKHIEYEHWANLKVEASKALKEWRKNNLGKKDAASWTDDFWMTGECFDHDVNMSSTYYDYGFDSMINFSFKKEITNGRKVNDIYKILNTVNVTPNKNVLNYISSHDTSLSDRNNLIKEGSALLLAPGAAQIFYGDETARQPHSAPWGWNELVTRSDMNWNSINNQVLEHFKKLGKFRQEHFAVGAGVNSQINSDNGYVFKREYNKDGVKDTVVIGLEMKGTQKVDVSSAFAEGVEVREAYSGKTAKVGNDGCVTFEATNGVMLIEKAQKSSGGNTSTLKGGAISTDPVDEQEVGKDVTITTAKATGGSGSYTYKFTVDGEVIQDYSSKTSAVWTPEEEGEYTIKVFTKDSNGVEVSKVTDFNVIKDSSSSDEEIELNISSLKANPTNECTKGDEVVFTTTAKGEGTLKYQYSIDGKVVRDYSTDKTYTWIAEDASEYTVKVTVKDSNNNTKSEEITYVVNDDKENDDKENEPITISSLEISPSEGQVVGSKIEISAKATGGKDTLSYKFVAINETGDEEEISASSIKSSVTWTPKEAGTYSIKVEVTDGNETKELSKEYLVSENDVTDELKITDVKINPSTIKAFDEVKIKILATGGAGDYTYKVKVNNTTIQNYKSNDEITWTPEEAGEYELVIIVKDSEGNRSQTAKNVTVSKKDNGDDSSEEKPTGDSRTVIPTIALLFTAMTCIIKTRKKTI